MGGHTGVVTSVCLLAEQVNMNYSSRGDHSDGMQSQGEALITISHTIYET